MGVIPTVPILRRAAVNRLWVVPCPARCCGLGPEPAYRVVVVEAQPRPSQRPPRPSQRAPPRFSHTALCDTHRPLRQRRSASSHGRLASEAAVKGVRARTLSAILAVCASAEVRPTLAHTTGKKAHRAARTDPSACRCGARKATGIPSGPAWAIGHARTRGGTPRRCVGDSAHRPGWS